MHAIVAAAFHVVHMMKPRVLSFVSAVCLAVTIGSHASQQTTRRVDPSTGQVWIGDMLVSPEVAAVLTAGQNTTQGAVVYNPSIPSISPWPWGLVPIEFSPEVSADRRALIWRGCQLWERAGPVVCIPRTIQTPYVLVRSSQPGCGASVGAYSPSIFSFGEPWCWAQSPVTHDLGHTLGFIHEHQRPDRDTYVHVDLGNVLPEFMGAYTIWPTAIPHTAYDFNSLMHYHGSGYRLDTSRPNIVARPEYADVAARMGLASEPSPGDLAATNAVYSNQLRAFGLNRPSLPVQTRFDRTDFLGAMDQLHAFYRSTLGLNRPNGLSLSGRPDFLGIATWIFDIYLGARSAGFDRISAFDIVVAAITQTDEWKVKHPGRAGLVPTAFSPFIQFDRDEFLSTLNRLDTFYSSAEGLRRPDGLSINGAPDFVGIATWIFDVYLNQRLTGGSPTAAWITVENAIKATDEWRSKH